MKSTQPPKNPAATATIVASRQQMSVEARPIRSELRPP